MTMMIDDAQLIRSFKSGDHDAFVTIVGEYRAELLRHAQRKVHDEAAAEDIVQEAFFRAYRAFDRLPDDSRVRPWIHQIVANVCVDEANRRRRETDKAQRVACDASNRTVTDIEQQLGLDIDSTSLGVALADLPDSHRNALTMRFVDELDYDEIAEQTGVTELNARARVSRARSAMRRALHGVAVIPLTVYFLLRRPARGALAAPPADPTAAVTTAHNVESAGRLATTLQPAIEAANVVAVSAPSAMPLLTKAAVGFGAVAVAFSAAPEQPIAPQPPAVTEAPISVSEPLRRPIVTVAPVAVAEPEPSAPPPSAAAAAPVPVAAPLVTETGDVALETVEPAIDEAVDVVASTVPPSTVPRTTAAPVTVVPVTEPPVTEPPVTEPPVTEPPVTEPPASAPVPAPLTGGSLSSAVSVTPAGPRLDVSGSVTLSVDGAASSGSLSGRLGVESPDPAGSRRIDGNLTLQLESGTVELRVVGYGTSQQATESGVVPTSLAMSGRFKASGATGRLASSGSFSATLSGGNLTITLTP